MWIRYQLQSNYFVSRLPAAFSLVPFPPSFWRGLVVSVAGRRFVAVPAVHRQLVFKRLNTFRQTRDGFYHPLKQRYYRLLALMIGSADFRFCGG
jgi:hypothetical protein